MTNEVLLAMLHRLNPQQPVIDSKKLAAVAVIVAGDASPKTLLIKRAEHSEDPWSGQVAFPGGKMGRGDSSIRETAERETKEEVGIDLTRNARFAGYFAPFKTHTGDMNVIPAVFLMEREVAVVPNGEVSDYKWVGLDEFLKPSTESKYRLVAQGLTRNLPAFAVDDYVVWGLTHRIVSSLLGISLA